MRKTVYDQLMALQIMPRAWEDWTAYRQILTDWIIEATEEKASALIVGAGACNDFDLCRLSSYYERLYLVDLDSAIMKAAVERQVKDSHLSDKIHIVEADLVGISPDQYRDYAESLQRMVQLYGRNCDIEQMTNMAIQKMTEGYQNRKRSDFWEQKGFVDHVIVCGVHSQLNAMYPWIWEAYCAVLGKKQIKVHQLASDFQAKLMPEVNGILLNMAQKSCIFGLEGERLGVPGGVEGAFQAMQDLQKRIERREVIQGKTTEEIWPFHPEEGIRYRMLLTQIEKSTIG